MNPMPGIALEEDRGPSRAEIETLCVLHAVGELGCRVGELPARLGLSSSLTATIKAAIEPLVAAGWLKVEDDLITATAAGAEHLRRRLAELGAA